MEMGSAGFNEHADVTEFVSNKEFGDDVNNSEELSFQRPTFYPCTACGRKFTLRALEIHKRSCTETSDCSCTVCKTSSASHTEHTSIIANALALSDKGNASCKLSNGTSVKYLHNGRMFYVITRSPGSSSLPSKNLAGPKIPVVLNGIHSIQETKCEITDTNADCLKPAVVKHADHSYSNVELKLEKSSLSNQKNVLTTFNNIDSDTLVNKFKSSHPKLRVASKIYVVYPNSAASVNPPEKKIVCSTNEAAQKNVRNHEESDKHDIDEAQKRSTVELEEEAVEKQKVLNAISPSHSLQCCVCKKSISWEAFGCHIVHHSQVVDKMLLCPKCPKKFTKPGMLLIHFHKHMSEFAFTCRECDKSFQNCVDLKQHGLSEHGYVELHPFHCYICLRRFSHSQTIINHMRLHSKEMPFKCNQCSRSFNQIGNLHRHLSVHRGERPHKCLDCGKSFADPATLRNHVRIHTGETPYVCKICTRPFTQVGNLKRHMARHLQGRSRTTAPESYGAKLAKLINSGTKNSHSDNSSNTVAEKNNYGSPDEMDVPSIKSDGELKASLEEFVSYVSNTSDSVSDENSVGSFVSVVSLNQEAEACKTVVEDNNETRRKSRRKQTLVSRDAQEEAKRMCDEKNWELFPCPVCAKVYTWQHDLNIHFRIHSGEKPYACDICNKRFAQSGAVRTHRLRHHAKAVESENS